MVALLEVFKVAYSYAVRKIFVHSPIFCINNRPKSVADLSSVKFVGRTNIYLRERVKNLSLKTSDILRNITIKKGEIYHYK